MALQKTLTEPWVIEPLTEHTHTVIFLHKFDPEADENLLRKKLLCEKRTKNGITLRAQFPTIRWVFPHAKQHPDLPTGAPDTDHWGKITAEERTALGLRWRDDIPYVTQVVMNEARRIGGTDRVVLGGVGIGAEAACRALQSFPEPPASTLARRTDLQERFVRHFFGHGAWTRLDEVRLAGFVGMHGYVGERKPSRDEADFWLLANRFQGRTTVAGTLLQNTPRTFVRGGYKYTTDRWDGHRVDVFARFVAGLGVERQPRGYVDADAEQARRREREKKEREADEKMVADMGVPLAFEEEK
ncbi:hypothetical protein F5Y19DRAFT_319461 [Xylariaceae sp. FL1651]|nr:hypothetical protein F5Y19DRAFT_319461 [Xylariaceae sp. FL1651]